MRRVLAILLVVGAPVLTPALAPAFAQAPFPPGWSPAARTGCLLWNLAPQPTQSVSWAGECVNGYAEGPGVAVWLVSGAMTERFEGTMARGKANGVGVKIYADGRRYEGDFRDAERSGKGTLTISAKVRFVGQWKNDKPEGPGVFVVGEETYRGNWRAGCLRDGGRLTWLETTRKKCEAH